MWLPVSAALTLCACSSAPPPVPPVTASLTLGASDEAGAFVPYAAGQDVTLVEGAQGGFHVWMRYHFDGTVGAEAALERSARRVADGELVLRSMVDVTMDRESQPLPMFMCPSPVGESVIEQPIDFELHFTADGRELADERITLVPHCPSENQDFCKRICTG